MKQVYLILAYLALSPWGWSLASAEEASWYDIEIIVFSNTDQNSLASEIWPDDPGLPSDENTIELTTVDATDDLTDSDSETETAAPESIAESAMLAAMPHAFQILPESEFKLDDVRIKLEKSRDHSPLLHIAWRQPVVARDGAKAIHLYTDIGKPPADMSETELAEVMQQTDTGNTDSEADTGPKITFDGNIMISRGRYLHLDTDLLFTRETNLQGYSFFMPAVEETVSDFFRVQSSRRMRSNDLHYIDHPLIGILALITPFELPEENADKIEVIPLQE